MEKVREKKLDGRDKKRLITAAAGIVGFCLIFYFMITGISSGFDDGVRNFFYGLRNDVLTPVVKVITYMGNWQTIVALCLVLLAVKRTRTVYGIPVSAGAVLVTVINKSIKHIVQRPRPDDILHLVNEGGFSFSSGHSITSIFVYGLLIYLIRENIKNKTAANILTVILAVPALCVGPSRIYLGVHYPTDVLAGWCLGIAILAGMIEALEIIKLRKKRMLK